jgi:fibronectin type 3 domain-containing protein
MIEKFEDLINPMKTFEPPADLKGESWDSKIMLSWAASKDSISWRSHYAVYRWEKTESNRQLWAEVAPYATKFVDTRVKSGVRYYYAVTSVAVLELLESSPSNVVEVIA